MTPSDRDTTGLLTRPDPIVQLISPTGERHASAEFDPWIRDIDVAALGRLYRDMVVVRRRRRGHRPPAAGSARRSGRRCSARRPRRSAPPGRCAADDFVFPSYRENGVAYCRGVNPGTRHALAGHRAGRLGPVRDRHGDAADDHRRADPARHRLRDGNPRTAPIPWPWPTSATARRARATSTRRWCSPRVPGPGGLLLPEQPAGRSPSPSGCSRSSQLAHRAAGYGIPSMRVDGNDVLAVIAATPQRARPRAARRRPDLHRGRDLPDGPAHDGGRSHPLPRPPTSSRSGRPDPIARMVGCWTARGVDRRAQRPSPARPTRRRRTAGGMHRHAGAGAAEHLRARLRRAALRAGAPAGPVRALPGEVRRDRRSRVSEAKDAPMTKMTLAGAQHRPPPRARRRPQGDADGRGHRRARRRFPRHRRAARTTSAPHRVVDTPLAESASSAPPSASRTAGTGRSWRSSSTVSSTRPSTRSSPRSRRCTTARGRGAACPSPSACPSAAASARPSTTPSRPRPTSRTPPGSASSPARTPQDAYTMIQQAIACDDPVLFFEPKRRYRVKGEVDETASSRCAALGGRVGRRSGTDVTLVTYGPLVRPHGRRRRRRRGGRLDRGHRPALARAGRLRHARGLGAQDRPARHHPRGRRSTAGSAPRSPRASPSAASTTSRPRRCGSPASTSRTRPRSSSGTTCPTWTASSTASTARSGARTR